MNDNQPLIYRLTWIALGVSLLSLLLLSGVHWTDGNVRIGLWLALLLVSVFVSIPLHGYLLLNSLFRFTHGQGWSMRWVYFYLLLTILTHVGVVITWGDFSELKDDINFKIDAMKGSGEAVSEKPFPARI